MPRAERSILRQSGAWVRRMWQRIPQRQMLPQKHKGTFVMALVSGEERPAVPTGGVVYVIGSMASPAPEPLASSTPPAPNLCRGCGKELTITLWRLQNFAKHRHWPVRC